MSNTTFRERIRKIAVATRQVLQKTQGRTIRVTLRVVSLFKPSIFAKHQAPRVFLTNAGYTTFRHEAKIYDHRIRLLIYACWQEHRKLFPKTVSVASEKADVGHKWLRAVQKPFSRGKNR
ncbi:hypothetical protein M378DRAFT_360379 [Amanita muscaria Koide BX008]|uniref:Uncharacterized protein n=1 Tax=Amanita muscaria (strain Koide BX008) TaxID=946122 RepID=A0A0C2SUU8_AMAMK|nr:hypothetical protein M378DRAFT_360379 [Amanita muscaria Koide BX008]